MSEHKFPTEVIDLPSQGKVYPKDSPLADGKVELKWNSNKYKGKHLVDMSGGKNVNVNMEKNSELTLTNLNISTLKIQ